MKAELIIVEAVPGDNFWPCGLSKEEVGWWNPENWPGKNIMGNLHMELREEVKEVERNRASVPICGGAE